MDQRSKTTVDQTRENILCRTEKFVPLVVPGLSSNSGSSSTSTTPPQDASSTSSSPASERSDAPAPGNWRGSPKTHKKKTAIEPRTTVFEIFQNGWRTSQKISKTQKCLHPHTFLMTHIRNVLQKCHSGNTVSSLTPKKTEISKSASEPRLQVLFAGGELAKQYHGQNFLVTRQQQITRSSTRMLNHGTITGTPSLFKNLPLNRFNHIRAKQRLLRRRTEVCASFSSRQKSRKSFTLTIHWNLANLVKIYHGITELHNTSSI